MTEDSDFRTIYRLIHIPPKVLDFLLEEARPNLEEIRPDRAKLAAGSPLACLGHVLGDTTSGWNGCARIPGYLPEIELWIGGHSNVAAYLILNQGAGGRGGRRGCRAKAIWVFDLTGTKAVRAFSGEGSIEPLALEKTLAAAGPWDMDYADLQPAVPPWPFSPPPQCRNE